MKILKSVHRNNSNVVFTLTVYDSEAVTSPEIEFKGSPEFFSLKSEGSRTDPFKRIIPASLTFTVLYGCPDYTLEQADAVKQFYDDLTNSYEGRFYVTLTGMGETLFRGKILPDVGDYQVKGYGDFIVTAIDGITDLQDKQYRPTGYTDLTPADTINTRTFNEHFLDLINRIDTVHFFKEYLHGLSVSISLMATANNWTESNSVSGDIWEQVRVRNFWFEQISKSYREYRSCWDVLKDLVTGFNARIVYERGRYYIEQLTIQDNSPETITINHYIETPANEIIAGSGLEKIQHNYDTNDDLKAGPFITQRRLPAFKAIELRQSKQFTNYIAGLYFAVPDNLGPFDFGYIIGEGNKLIIQWLAEISLGTAWSSATYSNYIKVEHIFVLKIKIGDYYLVADQPQYINGVTVTPNGPYHVSFGGLPPELNWSLIETPITIVWERTIISTSVNDFNSQASDWRQAIRNSSLILQSAEIQADGNLEIEFISFTTKRNGVTIGGFPPGGISLRNNSRVIIGTSYNDLYELPKSIKRYEVGDSRNSIVYPVDLGYYDSTYASTAQLFMSIEGNPLFTELPTIEWTDPDSGLTLPIQELMMKSMLSMRSIPSNTINIELFNKTNSAAGYIGAVDQVVFDEKVHIIIEKEMIASGQGGFTTYKCVLWEIFKDYIGINVVDTGDEPEPGTPTFPIPDGSLDSYNVNDVQSGVEFWEEWLDVSTAFVSPTTFTVEIVNTDDIHTTEIRQKWKFYVNGVKWRYVPIGTLKINEWRFDTDNNKFLYVKGIGNVKHIEVFKYY